MPSNNRSQSPPKAVRFSQSPPLIHDTWNKKQYDRSPEQIPTTIELGLCLPSSSSTTSSITSSDNSNHSRSTDNSSPLIIKYDDYFSLFDSCHNPSENTFNSFNYESEYDCLGGF